MPVPLRLEDAARAFFESEQARARALRETDPLRKAELLRKTGDAFIEADPDLKRRFDATRRYDVVRAAVERYESAAASGKFDLNENDDPLASDPLCPYQPRAELGERG